MFPGAATNFPPRLRSADVLEAGLEPAGVALLSAREGFEPLRNLFEALVTSGAREPRVHLGVLVGLAGDRGLQVVLGRPHGDTRHRVADLGEEVEVAERVPGLALRHRAEQSRDIGIALYVCLLREVEVTAIRLAFTRERLLEVLVGLASVEVGHQWAP